MNFFSLHIGDWAEATAHLSCLEDGIYGRLVRKYYATEAPLPSDVKAVQRLAERLRAIHLYQPDLPSLTLADFLLCMCIAIPVATAVYVLAIGWISGVWN